MKKFYLLILALVAMVTTANAGSKTLFKQDFESVTKAADAGWASPNLAGNMEIKSDEEGSLFRFFLGANNNRNAYMNFNYGLPDGTTIFDGQDAKKYTIKFTWGLIANPQSTGKPQDVQFSSEIAVLNNNWVSANKNTGYNINNGQYATLDSIYLFCLTQLKGAYSDTNEYWADNTDLSNYAFDFYINGDTNQKVTLEQDGWYDITIEVDTEARTAKYEIFSLKDNDVVPNGTGIYNIPENGNVYAKGLNVLLGRYNSEAQFDDIKIQVPTDGDYANEPTVALTGINLAERTYTIFFEEGEILHVKKTEGGEDTSVESPYIYTTTTSGTLDVWTESGTATSEHKIVEVDATPIKLPGAVVDITKVNAGYVKTLLMTVDNSTVPTQPQITLSWEYSNGDKSTGEVSNGAIYEADVMGTLTVTTHAYGFVETTITFENNTEFAVSGAVDFQHMTDTELTAKGFTEIDPLDASNMSGENNWTARKRLWYQIQTGVDAEQKPILETHVVYGPTADGCEAIRRFVKEPSTLTAEVSKSLFAPVVTWYSEAGDGSDVAAIKINYGIGLINQGCKGDGGTSINYPNAPISVDGLTDNDYYILYIVSDYGSSSKHPIYPEGTSVADATEMYKADNIGDGTNVQVKRGTESFSLYRIDTAIAKVEIFKATGTTGIQTLPYNQVISDHNAPIYNLNGVQVDSKNLTKGIYIKQGKKFVVK
jgi:hypothetical protein